MPALDEPVHICEYQATWPALFAAERARLSAALAVSPQTVQHIGSTAVPGLAAKPVIDLMLGLKEFPPAEAIIKSIKILGYEAFGEACVPERMYFRLRSPKLSANLHVVVWGGEHWVNNIALREFLRSNAAARERYAQAKMQAIASGAQTLLPYSSAKAAVIKALLREALAVQHGG